MAGPVIRNPATVPWLLGLALSGAAVLALPWAHQYGESFPLHRMVGGWTVGLTAGVLHLCVLWVLVAAPPPAVGRIATGLSGAVTLGMVTMVLLHHQDVIADPSPVIPLVYNPATLGSGGFVALAGTVLTMTAGLLAPRRARPAVPAPAS
ncbi:hypothetical protein [Streptomyces sp. YIM 98790]|uniref:hypothetical protein n=1 Tax=Streptomyces sp. YIM 98790 TaxID=2689077 RepID=UPI00140E81C8|nr:hypothetical protein [Streptomyces sp. YIM 98790]